MNSNSVFVTYCAKGQVRRDLEQIGFKVEKTSWSAWKREMLRATKMNNDIQKAGGRFKGVNVISTDG